MQMRKLMLAAALFMVTALPCLADPANGPQDDTQAVKAASAEFYTSLNEMFTGDVTRMKALWSHKEDVTYLGPMNDFLVGWQQVGEIWEQQAALKLGGQVLPVSEHVTVVGDLAVIQCREVGHNLDAEGKSLDVSIRATNTFRKENGEWKMIGHHTDLLPFLEK